MPTKDTHGWPKEIWESQTPLADLRAKAEARQSLAHNQRALVRLGGKPPPVYATPGPGWKVIFWLVLLSTCFVAFYALFDSGPVGFVMALALGLSLLSGLVWWANESASSEGGAGNFFRDRHINPEWGEWVVNSEKEIDELLKDPRAVKAILDAQEDDELAAKK